MSDTPEKTPNETLLEKQASSLKRLVKNSELSVVEIAKRIGVDRQTIYLWQRGKVAIPEDKLILLGKLFGKEPAEIRYDITLFNQNDMATVIRIIETELSKRGITQIKPERKAALVSSLYALYQSQKRVLHESFIEKDFESTVNHSIDSFTA